MYYLSTITLIKRDVIEFEEMKKIFNKNRRRSSNAIKIKNMIESESKLAEQFKIKDEFIKI